jgi:hypothetical protein
LNNAIAYILPIIFYLSASSDWIILLGGSDPSGFMLIVRRDTMMQ